jgi:hypothetical protein
VIIRELDVMINIVDSAEETKRKRIFDELCRRVKSGDVIPVISNSIFYDQIFDQKRLRAIETKQLPYLEHMRESPLKFNIEDELAVIWAQQDVDYPLPEQHWLPRVALYDRVINSIDERHAKERYLDWLKQLLLSQTEANTRIKSETIAGLRNELSDRSFTNLACTLGYPRAADPDQDPVKILAKLNLPIYITTSPFDFLERAIKNAGRKVRTQIFFWSEENDGVPAPDPTDRDFEPSREEPLVYHIFGHENYLDSMVLNEDDYLDFLTNISKFRDQEKQLVPYYLLGRLRRSSLILLGYRLRDWEFRVMFRGLLREAVQKSTTKSLAIQIDPIKEPCLEMSDTVETKIHKYLEKYFGDANFWVEWSTPQNYVVQICNEIEGSIV